MQINDEIFSVQYPILKNFICHLSYYRVLFRLYKEEEVHSEFWTRTIDAHLLRAVIDWCMVFGTDNNPTHWKKLPAKNKDRHIKAFRRLLEVEADLSPAD